MFNGLLRFESCHFKTNGKSILIFVAMDLHWAKFFEIVSSFLTKKYKLALAVVNEEIALVEVKTAQVEVDAQN